MMGGQDKGRRGKGGTGGPVKPAQKTRDLVLGDACDDAI